MAGPLVTIGLRDGTDLSVTFEGVRVGERFFELARIQDARQVAPQPLTVALRVAGERQLVEFQPTQPQDGDVVLETLYRLRPDLRPAGFVGPAVAFPPGAWPPPPPPSPTPYGPAPYPPYPPYAPYAPYAYPPAPGQMPPAPTPMGYPPYAAPRAVGPDTSHGKLTPYPRDFGGILSAIFELFGAHWKALLLLGAIVCIIPQLFDALADWAFQTALGIDLSTWQGLAIDENTDPYVLLQSLFHPLPPDQLALYAGIGLAAIILSLALTVIETAALALAGRSAVLGEPISMGGSIVGGIRRFWPVLAALLLRTFLAVLALVPGPLLSVLGLALSGGALASGASSSSDVAAVSALSLLFSCLGLPLIIAGFVFYVYLFIRWYFAPFIAATESLGPVAAMRKSWTLTRNNWWHAFLPVLVVGTLAFIVIYAFSLVQGDSYVVGTWIAIPLAAVLTQPFVALTAVVILYDLRLRREGYAAVAASAAKQAEPEAAPADAR